VIIKREGEMEGVREREENGKSLRVGG